MTTFVLIQGIPSIDGMGKGFQCKHRTVYASVISHGNTKEVFHAQFLVIFRLPVVPLAKNQDLSGAWRFLNPEATVANVSRLKQTHNYTICAVTYRTSQLNVAHRLMISKLLIITRIAIYNPAMVYLQSIQLLAKFRFHLVCGMTKQRKANGQPWPSTVIRSWIGIAWRKHFTPSFLNGVHSFPYQIRKWRPFLKFLKPRGDRSRKPSKNAWG